MADVKLTILGEDKSQPAVAGLDRTERAIGMVRNAAAALGLSFGAMKLVELGKDCAMLAARYDTLGVTMRVVGNNAGYTGEQMAAQEAQLRKTGIAAVEARQNLAMMAQSHIDLAKSAELARVAQDAAVIGGINSSEAFSRMIYGIQSAQTDVLRTIGINVSFEESYKKLGKQLNKNAEDLTEQEKVQARTNAVMEKGKDIAGSYEASMGTAGKQIASLKRYMDDLKVAVGGVFQDALIVLVGKFTDGLKEANDEAGRLQRAGQIKKWGEDAVFALAAVADVAKYGTAMIGTFTGTAVAGLMQVYKVGEAAYNLARGNLAGSKQNLREMAAIGSAWWDDMQNKWGGESFTSSARKMYADRERNAARDAAAATAAEQQRIHAGELTKREEQLRELTDQAVKHFQEKGKKIIELEKNRVKALIDLEEEYLKKMKSSYDSQVAALGKFADALTSVYQSWEERDKARADAARLPEEPLVRRARLLEELSAAEEKLNASWADPAAKVKGLNDLIPRYREAFSAIRVGTDDIIHQTEADRDFQIAEDRIKAAIGGVAAEMRVKESAAVDTAEAIIRAEAAVAGYNRQLSTLDQILKQLPSVKEINVNVRVNGMESLAQAGGFHDFGDYYTLGGSTYWADGSQADAGTSYVGGSNPGMGGVGMGGLFGSYAGGTDYVPRTGPYLLHQGEKVVPAARNTPGDGAVHFNGDIQFIIPNVTDKSTADDLVREAVPKLLRIIEQRKRA